jgi:hypothetical protein
MTEIERYIRQAAIARGIDPDIAVRIAMAEGGLANPTQQSNVVKGGRRETSFGPFQLRIGGGLGDRALAAGIDPRNAEDWRAGVDFALDEAARKGWGQWYGARDNGIANNAGLVNAHPIGTTLNSAPYRGNIPGGIATPVAKPYGGYIPGGIQPPPEAGAPVATPPSTGAPGLAGLFGEGGIASKLAGALGGGEEGEDMMAPVQQSSITPHIPDASAAAMLMAALMEDRTKKRRGTTLTSMG